MKKTDDLLLELPRCVGNHKLPSGAFVVADPHDQLGFLTLQNEGGAPPWCACYMDGSSKGPYVCLNPTAPEPPYHNLVAWGYTPNEALQNLRDLLKKHELIAR